MLSCMKRSPHMQYQAPLTMMQASRVGGHHYKCIAECNFIIEPRKTGYLGPEMPAFHGFGTLHFPPFRYDFIGSAVSQGCWDKLIAA